MLPIMKIVRKVKIDSYKVFFVYFEEKIAVFVNSQEHIAKGQRDVFGNNVVLSEERASAARNIRVRNYME